MKNNKWKVSGPRQQREFLMTDQSEKIPNNVNLGEDRGLQRALETWQPNFQKWWMEVGPKGFQQNPAYLRTAVSVEPSGWAHFDYVRMPEYRWGIFVVPPASDKKIAFGDFEGQPVWNEVPGEFRNALRRIIVTQGDTEPASVEQQRSLGHTAPSLYDLRNLFQVNVEEGRHLWAMVYLLHTYFGRDGREEARALLERRSGNPDKPRILGAFNQPIDDWLSFFMFTTFTDRDGKYQLLALAGGYELDVYEAGQLVRKPIALRSAMNEVLRDAYVEDCQKALGRWNKRLEGTGVELVLPSRRFHRGQGMFAGHFFDPAGHEITAEEFERRRDQWLPSEADRTYVRSLMAHPVLEPGHFASWIAPPPRGINGQPIDFRYVRYNEQ